MLESFGDFWYVKEQVISNWLKLLLQLVKSQVIQNAWTSRENSSEICTFRRFFLKQYSLIM